AGSAHFIQWYKKHSKDVARSHPVPDYLSAKQMEEELRIITGYSNSDYKALSAKQSLVNAEDRERCIQICELYRSICLDEGVINPDFIETRF
ncbi:hypothetical protein, partial [Legionella sp. CNM-4043-24]|uniref:hypothetical protein n=1 Tax=Legionella sp. CNM-4043-24 TaxID=3421646 RepID=UPI00403B342E